MRQAKIDSWIAGLQPGRRFTLAPASADASFRSYLRATFEDGKTCIVMDAPPDHEDVRPWLHVQRLFREAGVHVPEVLAQDVERGFLLLEDLGSTTWLSDLTDANADGHYRAASDALVNIQLSSRPGELPDYDRTLLKRELDLFPDWYAEKHLGIALSGEKRSQLEAVFEKILAVNLAEPQVYVHRDYHSRNLMVASPNPGIIDFQDAVFGPITYDLASLFKDAYVEWPEERTLDWLARYWEKAKKAGLPVRADFGEFHRDYEWMGVQRHVKVLGIFARLRHRDGKDAYLKDMPLVAKYLRTACARYRDLAPLLRLLDELENRQAQVGYTF
ncbi:MAG: phosphotransferase [Candidatus Nitricoxidivorans perseverans]|uniref:Phosphotransferase n=1 Tax=Candidatus Nitricoxidivorans perseverans TaxID=2975601 RepID=A0AA49J0A6_9PROT|nr:MAG: phosphotransferase [Candidatus Nitricoxidivorans perseverans]